MKVKNIVDLLIKKFPLNLQAEWDQSGLIVTANLEQKISIVTVALDLDNQVIEQAIRNNSNLIITHHPIFTTNDQHTPTEKELALIERLKLNQITYLALHTNFDFNSNGLNHHILKKLDLVKINFYKSKQTNIFEAKTRSPKLVSEIVSDIKTIFNVNKIVVQEKDMAKKVNNVALVAGSGFSTFVPAINDLSKDFDLLITGDIKWHDWTLSNMYDLTIIDAGHDLENHFINIIEEMINQKFKLIKVSKIFSPIKFKVY